MITLKEYLFQSGILDAGTSEEIAAAKKEYRKEYLREKKKAYRKTHKTISLSFANIEAEKLEKKALEYRMKLPEFIKTCLYAYLEQVFLIPDEAQVQQLDILLRKIGNNVNQITRLCNRLSMTPHQGIREIEGHLKKLDDKITALFRAPKSLESLVVEGLVKHPELLLHLQHILDRYTHAPKNHPASK